jgi:DNA invertase Pin-like site-specific DNA recombinase
MGRLTLNVLLSFAQFEREVTSERIRDKIAASKRKGLWVGGMAPLGYDTKDRRITVNDARVCARDDPAEFSSVGNYLSEARWLWIVSRIGIVFEHFRDDGTSD